jgi:A/G-specific adenine glycosylase
VTAVAPSYAWRTVHRRQDSAERLRSALLEWFPENGRNFPWRQTRNAFHILLAEVLLRQTQAERVVGPYLGLVSRFPDAHALANTNVEELRGWFRPLGLVRRAERLVRAAQIMVDQHEGQVPGNLDELLDLPGIGGYSARAVLCLGYGVPVPMVDEGSGRVLRRVLGMLATVPAYSDSQLLRTVEAMLPQASSREFNLGLIDIAAAYCRPRYPACAQCPLADACVHGQSAARTRPPSSGRE